MEIMLIRPNIDVEMTLRAGWAVCGLVEKKMKPYDKMILTACLYYMTRFPIA